MHCLGLVAVFLVAANPARPTEPAKNPPHVVLIVGDDQAWSDFGFMGHPVIRSPRLDRLASESLVFTRGYVPTSLCRPSLATLLTGRYPHDHGITGNDPAQRDDQGTPLERPKDLERCRELAALANRPDTLCRLLASAGYVSFQSGKWWEQDPRQSGFTEGMTHGDRRRGGRHGDEGLRIGREGLEPIFDFIDRHDGKPCFIWYAPFLPHMPHDPPERLLAHYRQPGRPIELARYFAMCEWFDETCGALLDGLDERGMTENTLVVFVVDNGWIQRTAETPVPENWRFPFAPRSKQSPHEGGIRTPIALRWPKQIAPKMETTQLAGSIDIAPTILSAAGVAIPADWPGIVLTDSERVAKREALFGEIFTHDVQRIGAPAKSLRSRWMIDRFDKLIVNEPTEPGPSTEFYDLGADPWEEKNLAAQMPPEMARMQQWLDTWWKP